MSNVSIVNRIVKFGEHEIPLLGGEVHYWRLNPANWRVILERVREMGIELVATYVCWEYHEIAPGEYDFSGRTDPHRNLTGFLDLLTDMGFWVLLRPGPYIYSEWKNGGVPDDAARVHRLDEKFQQRAFPYMKAVTEAAKPYLATHGGRIILWQADNEIDPWPHWYTEQLGLGGQPGPFQAYLRSRYANVGELNAAWGTDYRAIEQAFAVTAPFPDQPGMLRRYLDFVKFQHGYVNQVAEWTVGVYRELGVDVPISLNTYSGVGTQSWSDMETIADLVGIDIYPTQEFSHWPNEHRNFLDSARYAAAISKLPYIAEMEAGIWHDWLADVGTLTGNHYLLACISALSGGIAGWSWYMLVNRDNWYQSPINEWGRTRPELFTAFQTIAKLFALVKPYAWEKLTYTALTYDPLQRATVRPGQPLLQAMYEAGVDYTFFDLARGSCDQPLLFYAGGHWLSRQGQDKLKDYAANGGHLVLLGSYPYQDDALQPCNRLGIIPPEGVLKGLPRLDLELSIGAACSVDWMFTYRDVPGTPIYARRTAPKSIAAEELSLQWNLQNGVSYCVGYTQDFGRGKITMLGLTPSRELILALYAGFSVKIPARALTPGIQTACFRREAEIYLTVTNSTSEDKHVLIDIDPELVTARNYTAWDLLSGQPMDSGRYLAAYVPRKCGTVIVLKARQP